MADRGYCAAHWGVYEVTPDLAGGVPSISPLSIDPDPNPIGLDQLDPSVSRLRRGWLERSGGRGSGRGEDPFVERAGRHRAREGLRR